MNDIFVFLEYFYGILWSFPSSPPMSDTKYLISLCESIEWFVFVFVFPVY